MSAHLDKVNVNSELWRHVKRHLEADIEALRDVLEKTDDPMKAAGARHTIKRHRTMIAQVEAQKATPTALPSDTRLYG